MNGTMTAKKLRLALFVSMLLVIVAVAGGFLFVERNLRDYAVSISRLNADAQSGDQNIQTLKNLQKRLAEEQDTITSARSVVADNATYAKQVIDDISRMASESNVVVTSIEFPKDAVAGTAAPAAPTTIPGQTTTTTTAPAPSGVTKKTVTVSIQSPLKYSNLLNFIQKVETNDLKMQFASVTLAKEKDDAVTTQTFMIEVYVRQ